jgi:hypothetical protein
MRRLLPILALIALAGCNAGGVAVPPYPPVPAALPDPMPKPPVTPIPLVWQAGHWDWNGAGYVWQTGQWVPAEGHGPNWQPGWWNAIGGQWRWEPPHWVDG